LRLVDHPVESLACAGRTGSPLMFAPYANAARARPRRSRAPLARPRDPFIHALSCHVACSRSKQSRAICSSRHSQWPGTADDGPGPAPGG
jgi:hypothetical protein